MHADQVDVPVEVVAALVAEQFPRWQGLPVRPVPSGGTVNALFRLGDDVVLRFPLQPAPWQRDSLEREQAVARRLAGRLPVEVPEPLGLGSPGPGYDGSWAAYRWIAGDPPTAGSVADLAVADRTALARDLAGVVLALRSLGTGGRSWDGRSRGGPLAVRDDGVRAALAASRGLVDVDALAAVWERCLRVPVHDGAPVWLHADLMPGNLLVRDARLAAVIDLGAACVGDPAVDLMPAWNLLPADARPAFRDALADAAAGTRGGGDAVRDDDAWERGRGWALVQAIQALPYYLETQPSMADTARRTLAAVLEDA